MHLRAKWVDVAHSINEPASGRHGREPRFSDLAKFVDEKSRIASSMYGLDLTREISSLKVVRVLLVTNKLMVRSMSTH